MHSNVEEPTRQIYCPPLTGSKKIVPPVKEASLRADYCSVHHSRHFVLRRFERRILAAKKPHERTLVLWKAMQSVFGAVESAKRQMLHRVFNVVTDSVSFARRINRTVSEVIETEFFSMA